MKRIREPLHILNMLKKQARKPHLSFHTPGHKKRGFDITELSYSDNLSSPQGCLKWAQEDIARILGAEKSFILTDGSTCGVLSMLHALKESGVKTLAFPISAHKSVWNGCKLLGLTPLLLSECVDITTLENEDKEAFHTADALFLTSPSYYGFVPNLQAVRALCERENKPLVIDGAHGSHLHFEKEFYAGAYADMWVDGVHKNLPSLTQGAVVSAQSVFWAEKLATAVDIFRTTSPSYPIMQSVEYAVKYPRNERLENAVKAYASKEKRVQVNQDWTKLCAWFGSRAFEAEKALEKRGIYPEFCDGFGIVFYLSPATKLQDFRRLKKELARLFLLYPFEEGKSVQRNPAPLVFDENKEKEWVGLDESEQRICAQNCGLFPPCTPLILVGERIEREKIETLKKADNYFGIFDGKILVFKE